MLYLLGVNSFWTTVNTYPVMDSLSKLNGRVKATSISSVCFPFYLL